MCVLLRLLCYGLGGRFLGFDRRFCRGLCLRFNRGFRSFLRGLTAAHVERGELVKRVVAFKRATRPASLFRHHVLLLSL